MRSFLVMSMICLSACAARFHAVGGPSAPVPPINNGGPVVTPPVVVIPPISYNHDNDYHLDHSEIEKEDGEVEIVYPKNDDDSSDDNKGKKEYKHKKDHYVNKHGDHYEIED